jgi:hypothetical protein
VQAPRVNMWEEERGCTKIRSMDGRCVLRADDAGSRPRAASHGMRTDAQRTDARPRWGVVGTSLSESDENK